MPKTTEQSSQLRLTFWKKVAFSAVATTGSLLLFEAVLLLAGVQPLVSHQDPLAGFSTRAPLFVGKEGRDGLTEMVTAENKLGHFNLQRFPKTKDINSRRVFCLGGSTTYGRPYNDTTSFCGWLRAFLHSADPTHTWEVINAGGVSYASHRILLLMKELVSYEPDFFILYTGHNEFLERRTYSRTLAMPEAMRGLTAIVYHTRIATVLKRAIDLVSSDELDSPEDRHRYSDEVVTLLDTSVGPEDYTRDDAQQELILREFSSNLDGIIDIAESARARVLLVVPASNLRDCSPFKSQHKEGMSEHGLQTWNALFGRAKQAYSVGQYETATSLLAQAASIDGRYALLHYLRGRAAYAQKRHDQARAAFLRARDEDVCPLRALSGLEDIVAGYAGHENVHLVEFDKLVRELSEGGMPGDDLFLDHVHPSVATNRRLGLLLLDAFIAEKVVQPAGSWSQLRIDRVTRQVESRVTPEAHAAALRNLSKVLGWAGKYEEAGRLAERALAMTPDDAEAHLNAGAALAKMGNYDAAMAHYRQVLRIWPQDRSLGGLASFFALGGGQLGPPGARSAPARGIPGA